MTIRLVTRGDDAGSCKAADLAIRDAAENGILRNVSLLVPGPSFAHAVAVLKELDGICVGLHAAITAEWPMLKWGPVLPVNDVPTLVDRNGMFPATTQVHRDRRAEPDEILREIEAQLQRARDAGLQVDYLDLHMGFGWLDGVQERIDDLRQREGLIAGDTAAARLPRCPDSDQDLPEALITRLRLADPGDYIVVGHPGYADAEDFLQLALGKDNPGDVARRRDAQRRMFMQQNVLDFCREHDVVPTRFTDL